MLKIIVTIKKYSARHKLLSLVFSFCPKPLDTAAVCFKLRFEGKNKIENVVDFNTYLVIWLNICLSNMFICNYLVSNIQWVCSCWRKRLRPWLQEINVAASIFMDILASDLFFLLFFYFLLFIGRDVLFIFFMLMDESRWISCDSFLVGFYLSTSITLLEINK